jgi:tRNA/rRNA methyltransferase
VTVACALTSRRRELTTPLSTPRETTPELVARARDGEQVALVFGNETFGLSIEEVEQCNRLVTIPGNPDYFSLNLAMAVQVMTYELFSHTGVDVEYLRRKAKPPAWARWKASASIWTRPWMPSATTAVTANG